MNTPPNMELLFGGGFVLLNAVIMIKSSLVLYKYYRNRHVYVSNYGYHSNVIVQVACLLLGLAILTLLFDPNCRMSQTEWFLMLALSICNSLLIYLGSKLRYR